MTNPSLPASGHGEVAGLVEAIAILSRAVEQPDPATEIARLTRQLHSLAVALHRKHYADVPQWQPLSDAEGLLSQIDNMTTELCRTARAEARIGEIHAELGTMHGRVLAAERHAKFLMTRQGELIVERDAAQPDLTAAIATVRSELHRESKARDFAEARAERAESELAVIREALENALGLIERPEGKAIRDDESWAMYGPAFRAALANTAHQGQEEKGNG